MRPFEDCAIRSKVTNVKGFELRGLNEQLEQLNALQAQLMSVKKEIRALADEMVRIAACPVTVTGFDFEQFRLAD